MNYDPYIVASMATLTNGNEKTVQYPESSSASSNVRVIIHYTLSPHHISVKELIIMGLSVCPSAIVAAPVETVWSLLDPLSQLGTWADGEVISVKPDGPTIPGQRMVIRSRAAGRTWDVTFVVEEVHPERHILQTNVSFPFGMHLHERIMCNPIDAVSCRVQYG